MNNSYVELINNIFNSHLTQMIVILIVSFGVGFQIYIMYKRKRPINATIMLVVVLFVLFKSFYFVKLSYLLYRDKLEQCIIQEQDVYTDLYIENKDYYVVFKDDKYLIDKSYHKSLEIKEGSSYRFSYMKHSKLIISIEKEE